MMLLQIFEKYQCLFDMETKTPVIHISRSQQFYDDLQKAGGNVINSFITIPGKNHGSSARVEITTEFVKRCNKLPLK